MLKKRVTFREPLFSQSTQSSTSSSQISCAQSSLLRSSPYAAQPLSVLTQTGPDVRAASTAAMAALRHATLLQDKASSLTIASSSSSTTVVAASVPERDDRSVLQNCSPVCKSSSSSSSPPRNPRTHPLESARVRPTATISTPGTSAADVASRAVAASVSALNLQESETTNLKQASTSFPALTSSAAPADARPTDASPAALGQQRGRSGSPQRVACEAEDSAELDEVCLLAIEQLEQQPQQQPKPTTPVPVRTVLAAGRTGPSVRRLSLVGRVPELPGGESRVLAFVGEAAAAVTSLSISSIASMSPQPHIQSPLVSSPPFLQSQGQAGEAAAAAPQLRKSPAKRTHAESEAAPPQGEVIWLDSQPNHPASEQEGEISMSTLPATSRPTSQQPQQLPVQRPIQQAQPQNQSPQPRQPPQQQPQQPQAQQPQQQAHQPPQQPQQQQQQPLDASPTKRPRMDVSPSSARKLKGRLTFTSPDASPTKTSTSSSVMHGTSPPMDTRGHVAGDHTNKQTTAMPTPDNTPSPSFRRALFNRPGSPLGQTPPGVGAGFAGAAPATANSTTSVSPPAARAVPRQQQQQQQQQHQLLGSVPHFPARAVAGGLAFASAARSRDADKLGIYQKAATVLAPVLTKLQVRTCCTLLEVISTLLAAHHPHFAPPTQVLRHQPDPSARAAAALPVSIPVHATAPTASTALVLSIADLRFILEKYRSLATANPPASSIGAMLASSAYSDAHRRKHHHSGEIVSYLPDLALSELLIFLDCVVLLVDHHITNREFVNYLFSTMHVV
ncbi:hypothetical protein CAOG_05549 [Capsaspora owczarzaki ATCC 30864]|uniref:Uncharacterized protein n=1 Tax=Capsaspora owczarzaki (strain ATCC 30864) TaxID=595528 RepID=A0A0D2X3X2_CAPO3|nr:hypothetical protein CAOG_05549 [Capsaspora owczarzaki ATCC 30864]KJE95054.1 hypothetical protein CAOG_005549 [Capsaspora owczarzaki ATCC 30864]|eukprot:XP_004346222.1 hypothetical protein CAOG_05549 [Capsaspora owczarzaki ATCC 30864]